MLRRLLLVLGLIVVFAAGFWIARGIFKPKEHVVTQAEASVLLEKMQTVAKLVTVEGYFTELYSHKDYWRYDWWIFRKKALLRVKARVSVGYDLEGLDIKADTATKTITIRNIPKEPEIISIDHSIDYYDISEGSFNTFTPEDYNKLNKKARDLIEQKAKESDLIKQAREQGIEIINLIQFIGESAGWTVQQESASVKPKVETPAAKPSTQQMTGAFRVARFFNIPVRVHWSFFVLVLGYVLYAGFDTDWDKMAMLWSGIFVLVLFFLVVLHEFGHALTARLYGVNTRDIILLPIGGVARLDHLPEKPAHEFWVAIAGPLVNVALAILFSLYLFRFTPDQRWEIMNGVVFAKGNFFLDTYSNLDRFIFFMAWLNVILATFNLIPAFPMDGGRILRALLSIGLGRLNATLIAARIGQLLALGMITWGIQGIWAVGQVNPMYVLIGLFILFTAENEYRSVRMEDMVSKLKVNELMRGNFSRIYLDDSVEEVLKIYALGLERNFLVFDQWQNLMGVLPEFKLLDARKKKDLQAPVSKYMLRDIYPLVSAENLRGAFGVLQVSDAGAMPVYNPWNRLIGVLDEHQFAQDLKKKMKDRKWFGKNP